MPYVPLCLAHSDGSMTKSQKGKFAEIIFSDNISIENEEVVDKHTST